MSSWQIGPHQSWVRKSRSRSRSRSSGIPAYRPSSTSGSSLISRRSSMIKKLRGMKIGSSSLHRRVRPNTARVTRSVSFSRQSTKSKSGLDNGLTELTRQNYSTKMGSKKNYIRKLVNANVQTAYFRWSAMQPFNNSGAVPINTSYSNTTEICSGAYVLNNYTSNNFTVYPFHLYEINSSPNICGGSAVYPNPMFEMSITSNASVPSVAWDNSNYSQSTAGVSNVTGWVPENTASSTSGTVNFPNREGLLDWTSIRLLCYGTLGTPVIYKLELFQLREDYLHPAFGSASMPETAGNDLRNNNVAFWQEQAYKSFNHPLNTQTPKFERFKKVIATKSFTIQPQLTISEDSTTPHMHLINWFIPMSRKCKFDWDDNIANTFSNELATGSFQQDQGAVSTSVELKARIYLSIQATSCTHYGYGASTSGIPAVGYLPSYDILLRNKWKFIT